MKEVNRIITECNLSKVKIAKYLGVSRQMLYNYLAVSSIDEIPKDKKNKLLKLFNVATYDEIKKIKVDNSFMEIVTNKLNSTVEESNKEVSLSDLKGLEKQDQELLIDIFNTLKDKLIMDKTSTTFKTLRYLFHFIQTMDQVEELKYMLAYFAKYNCFIKVNESIYDENKQYSFEGILYTAMSLYYNGNPSRARVSESHKKFEEDIESKKEEKLSRTEELNTFREMALQELGYTSINDSNAKEVFEKIVEIEMMSKKD